MVENLDDYFRGALFIASSSSSSSSYFISHLFFFFSFSDGANGTSVFRDSQGSAADTKGATGGLWTSQQRAAAHEAAQ